MQLRVETDPHAGFCGGVIRAIGRAEQFLDGGEGKPLYSLGAIVHNEEELARLQAKGLVTISHADMQRAGGKTVLIRAHGEPPSTYQQAQHCGCQLIDCTCPVVLQLQRRIREADARLHEGPDPGELLIFGKIGHAEVLGLEGQAADAIVFENQQMLSELIERGVIDLSLRLEIFSQTTKSPDEYRDICDFLRARSPRLRVHDTICQQVASRHEGLSAFARSHDVIVFVSGSSSSNGRVLCKLCRSVNPRTYPIASEDQIDPAWFVDGDLVGVSGATSTPQWLLDAVAKKILQV